MWIGLMMKDAECCHIVLTIKEEKMCFERINFVGV